MTAFNVIGREKKFIATSDDVAINSIYYNMRLTQLLHKVERRSRSHASELPNCVTIFEYQVYWNIAAKELPIWQL